MGNDLRLRIETSFGPEVTITVPHGIDVPDWVLHLMERAGDESFTLEQARDWLAEGGFDEGSIPIDVEAVDLSDALRPAPERKPYDPSDEPLAEDR